MLTIRMLQVHPGPDTTVQQTPLNVVGLRVPHAQPLVILHGQSHMLPSLVGDQELLQLLVEAWVCVGQLYQLFELAHCMNADTEWEKRKKRKRNRERKTADTECKKSPSMSTKSSI
jgi:hypothetical protein